MRAHLLIVFVLSTSIALPIAALAQDSKITRQAELTGLADQLVDDILHRARGLDLGWDVKFGRVLGDRVAVAITKRLRMRDLDSADNAERVLKLLEYGFFDPDQISDAGDAKPAVTLFLADYLAEHCSVASLRLRASDLVTKLVALNGTLPAAKAGQQR
jgi:hypothetical protein